MEGRRGGGEGVLGRERGEEYRVMEELDKTGRLHYSWAGKLAAS